MKALYKISVLFFILIWVLPLTAEELCPLGKVRQICIQEEMRLINTYLKGIDDELNNPEPQMDQLALLSELILDSAYKIERTKLKKTFHEDFKTLLRNAKDLHYYSKKNKYDVALKQAESLHRNCISCHISQMK